MSWPLALVLVTAIICLCIVFVNDDKKGPKT